MGGRGCPSLLLDTGKLVKKSNSNVTIKNPWYEIFPLIQFNVMPANAQYPLMPKLQCNQTPRPVMQSSKLILLETLIPVYLIYTRNLQSSNSYNEETVHSTQKAADQITKRPNPHYSLKKTSNSPSFSLSLFFHDWSWFISS